MGTVSEIEVQRRRDMARVVLQVMRDWGLTDATQARLLGTAESTPDALVGAFEAGLAQAEEERLMQHMSALLAIHKALLQMHPQSVEMANYWITTPHPYFNDEPPLNVMVSRGLAGMHQVIEHLYGRGEWG